MSDLGATDQFSLHRFESPFTTSACESSGQYRVRGEKQLVPTLLPMSRKRPMTFLRHVPILPHDISSRSLDRADSTHLLNMSLCSASLRMRTSSSILSTSYSMF